MNIRIASAAAIALVGLGFAATSALAGNQGSQPEGAPSVEFVAPDSLTIDAYCMKSADVACSDLSSGVESVRLIYATSDDVLFDVTYQPTSAAAVELVAPEGFEIKTYCVLDTDGPDDCTYDVNAAAVDLATLDGRLLVYYTQL